VVKIFFRGTLTCYPEVSWQNIIGYMRFWLPWTPNNAEKRGYAARDVDCAWLEVPKVACMPHIMRLKSSRGLRMVAQDVRLGRLDDHIYMLFHTSHPSRGVQWAYLVAYVRFPVSNGVWTSFFGPYRLYTDIFPG
jgi:hypothetical protein